MLFREPLKCVNTSRCTKVNIKMTLFSSEPELLVPPDFCREV